LQLTTVFAGSGLLVDQMSLSIMRSVRMDYYVVENSVFNYAMYPLRVCVARTMPSQDVRLSVRPSVCHTPVL